MKATALDQAQALVAAALIGASLVAVVAAFRRALSLFSRRELAALASIVAVAATLRWFVAPLRIATVFIGYLMTQEAIDLVPIGRYGAGSAALYHALFAWLPHDHLTLERANSIIGVATLPLFAAFVARLTADRRAGLVAAAMVAVIPMFVRNDNSDANNVPCLLWLMGALVLVDEHVERRTLSPLVGATALASLAAICRPEMPALVGGLVALLVWAVSPRPREIALDRRVWAALACSAAAITPHALHIVSRLGSEHAGETWLARGRLTDVPTTVLTRSSVVEPRLYPITALALALLGLARAPIERRRKVALGLMALLAFTLYVIDLDWANVARVHVPGALLTTALAALGALFVFDASPRAGKLSWPLRAAVAMTLVGAIIPTGVALFAPTNEEAEEQLIRDVLARLPKSEPYTLIRLDHDDRDRSRDTSSFTHHYFPDYLAKSATKLSVRELVALGKPPPRTYFFWGMRCHAQFRRRDEPRPSGDNVQPACAEMRERFDLRPVLERDVPNHGDVWLSYYGDAPAMRLGLYEVRERR